MILYREQVFILNHNSMIFRYIEYITQQNKKQR